MKHDLRSKLKMYKKEKDISISFLIVPTPILIADTEIMSPNRTNYWPFSQLVLASCIEKRFQTDDIPWTVRINDFKSIENVYLWNSKLYQYGECYYDQRKLGKYLIGHSYEEFELSVEDNEIYAITSNFTFESNVIISFIDIIRRKRPNALILLGGRDATARSEYYLSRGADIVFKGYGEETLTDFLVNLYLGKEIELANYTIENKESVIRSRVPIDFSLVQNTAHRYIESGGGGFYSSILNRGRVAYYQTSRGCVRECNFCAQRRTGVQTVCLDRFKADMELYVSHGISTVMLCDDNLLLRIKNAQERENVIAMFEYLRKLNMVWEFPVGLEIGKLINADKKPDTELIQTLFWNNDTPENYLGAFRVLFPLENSLSSSTGDKLSKLKTVDESLEVLFSIVKTGLPQVNTAVMIGFCEESPQNMDFLVHNIDEIRQRIDSLPQQRNIKNKINWSIFCTTPLPGTPFYDQMRKDNRIEYNIQKDPELWNLHTSVVRGDFFTCHEITNIRKKLLNLFNSNQVEGKVKGII